MAKNLMPNVCTMLGLELGEKFKIKGDVGTYEFGLEGLWGDYGTDAEALEAILRGSAEIAKLPWKPKKGEKYWGFWYSSVNDAWLVLLYTWANNPADFALYKAGWVYRTEKEAKAALPKVAAEFGVEYKL